MIPYTDHECRLVLDEIYRGDKIVVPSSLQHARFMIEVAEEWIKKNKKEMWDTLSQERIR